MQQKQSTQFQSGIAGGLKGTVKRQSEEGGTCGCDPSSWLFPREARQQVKRQAARKQSHALGLLFGMQDAVETA
jgi:hypothetical protein